MSAPPALLIEDLRFRYADEGPWVVDVASLALDRGEQMLLTGGSGQGKSTLLQLITGLLEPATGRIAVAGQDVHALRAGRRDRWRGRHIGMIFQTFNLLHGFSALENVLVALMFSTIPRPEHARRARELLAGLGIDTPDALADDLSVGQQQRVAVARAVACGPNLVLADEPTASLDPDNAGAAMDLIQETCRARGAALLCTSHDPAMAPRFPRRANLRELAGPVPEGASGGPGARAWP